MDRNQNQELASNQVPVLFLNTKKKKNSETRTKQRAIIFKTKFASHCNIVVL